MKPTVGRIIHYHSSKNAGGLPFAAIIVGVNQAGVSASVMRPDGGRFIAELPLKPHDGSQPAPQDDEAGKTGREWWVWPPRDE